MERTERDTPELFLHEILIMGELMQTCGAEVFRVEDTLARMGKAYGVERMNVFVITSSIVITMELKDGRELTQTRRVRKAGGNDFTRLECLNVLSREYCEDPFPAGELDGGWRRSVRSGSRDGNGMQEIFWQHQALLCFLEVDGKML